MFTTIRRKLLAGRNALGFCRARPMDNPGYIAAVEELAAALARAETLATQEFLGHDVFSTSVETKAELRHALQETLTIIGDLADTAAKGNSDLSLRIAAPRVRTNHRTFLTVARSAVEKATANKETLIKYGMPEGLLEEVSATLDKYLHAADDKTTGRSAHVGASADLTAVTDRIMQLIRQLDALNHYRFRNDPELLASWLSARDIEWPHIGRRETGNGGQETPGATPAH